MNREMELRMEDESRRFLRYVVPGLVYGIETLLLVFIAAPDPTIHAVMQYMNGKDNLGVAVTAFIASGGLGFIFASAHHYCNRHIPFDKKRLDHRPILLKLHESELIKLTEEEHSLIGSDSPLGRKKAEVVSSAYWYEHLESHAKGKARLDVLGNNAHSLGAARIASLLAVISAVLICGHCFVLDPSPCAILRFIVMLILGLGATTMFHMSWSYVAEIAQCIYDRILENELTLHKRKSDG